MFLRARWFLLGVGSTVGGGMYIAAKLRKVRAGFTAAAWRRAAMWAAADLLDGAGRALGGTRVPAD